jgi:hypothetical protein
MAESGFTKHPSHSSNKRNAAAHAETKQRNDKKQNRFSTVRWGLSRFCRSVFFGWLSENQNHPEH